VVSIATAKSPAVLAPETLKTIVAPSSRQTCPARDSVDLRTNGSVARLFISLFSEITLCTRVPVRCAVEHSRPDSSPSCISCF
jgi:hypothetical protein